MMNAMALVLEEGNTERIIERFLKDVVYERYTDQILMVKRGNLLGFDIKEHVYTAINIQFANQYQPSVPEQRQIRNYCRQLQTWLRGQRHVSNCHLIDHIRYCILIVESPKSIDVDSLIRKQLTEEGNLKEWNGDAEIVCGIGPGKEGLQGIKNSYSLSFEALKVGQVLYHNRKLFFYKELEVFCELEQLFSRTETTELFTSVLKGVKEDYLETLMIYYECNRSLELTAEKLFTHRNTVKYRLKRIQEQTGFDIKNSSDSFRLYLAVLAMRLKGL
jgi:purine catabolism regulator